MDRDDSLSAARAYLRGVGVTERTYPTKTGGRVVTWQQVLRDTADAMEETAQIGWYLGGRGASRGHRTAVEASQSGSERGSKNAGVGHGGGF